MEKRYLLDHAFFEMFGLEWTARAPEEMEALRDDLESMLEECGEEPRLAAQELRRRIGGEEALASYAQVLVAGRSRKALRSDRS